MNTALTAHSWDTQNRVQQALDMGYEVTIHQSPITESGWTGAGCIQIDPSTGAGGYMIEGGANGAILIVIGILHVLIAMFIVNYYLPLLIMHKAIMLVTAALFFIGVGEIITGLGLLMENTLLCLIGSSIFLGEVLQLLANFSVVAASLGGPLSGIWGDYCRKI